MYSSVISKVPFTLFPKHTAWNISSALQCLTVWETCLFFWLFSNYGLSFLCRRHASLPIEVTENPGSLASAGCRRGLPCRKWKSASFGYSKMIIVCLLFIWLYEHHRERSVPWQDNVSPVLLSQLLYIFITDVTDSHVYAQLETKTMSEVHVYRTWRCDNYNLRSNMSKGLVWVSVAPFYNRQLNMTQQFSSLWCCFPDKLHRPNIYLELIRLSPWWDMMLLLPLLN